MNAENRKYIKKLSGSKGGSEAARRMTPEQRKRRAQKARQAQLERRQDKR